MAVAPQQTLAKLADIADEVVCLASPEPFIAVSLFFQDFSQVGDGDDEVMAILAADRARLTGPVSPGAS